MKQSEWKEQMNKLQNGLDEDTSKLFLYMLENEEKEIKHLIKAQANLFLSHLFKIYQMKKLLSVKIEEEEF